MPPIFRGRAEMCRFRLYMPLSMALILLATPAAATPLLLLGVLAAATVVGVSATQQPYEQWSYTDKYGWVGGTRQAVTEVEAPLPPRRGVSPAVLDACRDAIMRTAQSLDVASVEVASGGKQVRMKDR